MTRADAIVILGYGPPVDKKGTIRPELLRRVEAGADLFSRGLAEAIIVTGGNTYKDYYESAVMKEALLGLGVPADSVIEEREAMDTIGNARYSAKIMKERGWTSCILVSSPYHLKRAARLFRAADLAVQAHGCETPSNPFYGIVNTLYESAVSVQYAFIDEESLVKDEKGEKRADRLKKAVRARTNSTP